MKNKVMIGEYINKLKPKKLTKISNKEIYNFAKWNLESFEK